MGFDEIIKELLNIVRKFRGVKKVILFGSFAKKYSNKNKRYRHCNIWRV